MWHPDWRLLTVAQLPVDTDLDPLSIWAAALSGSVSGFDTDGSAFFGAGGRAAPDAVVADRLSGSIAPPSVGPDDVRTVLTFRSPVRLEPGARGTLRYAYGAAHESALPALLDRYQSGDPWPASEASWRGWLPQASFDMSDGNGPWLARELQWDAAMLRSGTTFEETCGYHVLSQGGYYQYGLGLQGAFRDPPALMIPLAYSEPELAREVLRYSAHEQRAVSGELPYTMAENCIRVDLPSADLDFWLLWAAAEYGLATRDLSFFDEAVPFADAGSASLWEHLKLAYLHQELVVGRGPHGEPLTAVGTGDWSDFSAQFLQLTESPLLAAQLAYAYPRLAELADARGDAPFAAVLRADGEELRRVVASEWTGRGWFSRGYAGVNQLGAGVIYAEPQAWALLAGAASPEQEATLVANVRRYLTGVGAPGGPSPIGSAQVPSASDPDVTEKPLPLLGDAGLLGSYGGGNAAFFGGVWYALNGPLVWATASLDGTVGGARERAWDELLRNTLANHATVYPEHWNGVISVDDACSAWYAHDPSRCGDESLTEQYHYDGQIMNQPAWALISTLRAAGIEPTGAGYRIAPHVPLERFSLRLPLVGLEVDPGRYRGYLTPEQGGAVRIEVVLPRQASATSVSVWVGGKRVTAKVAGGSVRFTMPTRAHRPSDWAVLWDAG